MDNLRQVLVPRWGPSGGGGGRRPAHHYPPDLTGAQLITLAFTDLATAATSLAFFFGGGGGLRSGDDEGEGEERFLTSLEALALPFDLEERRLSSSDSLDWGDGGFEWEPRADVGRGL